MMRLVDFEQLVQQRVFSAAKLRKQNRSDIRHLGVVPKPVTGFHPTPVVNPGSILVQDVVRVGNND